VFPPPAPSRLPVSSNCGTEPLQCDKKYNGLSNGKTCEAVRIEQNKEMLGQCTAKISELKKMLSFLCKKTFFIRRVWKNEFFHVRLQILKLNESDDGYTSIK